MNACKSIAGLLALGVFFVAGANEAYGLVPDAPNSQAGVLVGLQTVLAALAGVADAALKSGIDLNRTAVPLIGAIWLAASGWGFLGWFGRDTHTP